MFPVHTLSSILPVAALGAAFLMPIALELAALINTFAQRRMSTSISHHREYLRISTIYLSLAIYVLTWLCLVPSVPLEQRGYKWWLHIIDPPGERILLLLFWAITAGITVGVFLFAVKPLRPDRLGPRKQELNWRRKVFHIIGTIMILPAAKVDVNLSYSSR